jgi:antitoxin component of MazEF toxin-antitoxin module
MVKTITKIGNSQGLIFDQTLMDLAGLRVGDEVNVTLHDGGTLRITPVRPQVSAEEVTETIRKTVKDYRRTLKRLS